MKNYRLFGGLTSRFSVCSSIALLGRSALGSLILASSAAAQSTVGSGFSPGTRHLGHRDSRLAIGVLADGSLIVALTRFTGLGKTGETIPWGPTVPEMAAFMRSLGCVRAMLLDGGISSQLVVRDGDGRLTRWPNWRPVPLALVVSLGK